MQFFDWSQSSVEARKLLYRAVKRTIDNGELDWKSLYNNALGRQMEIGSKYEDNFRKGLIGRPRAAKIARFLNDNFPNYAADLERDLELLQLDSECSDGAWENLLSEHGQFGNLNVVLMPPQPLSVVSFADLEPIADQTVKLGERFCFRLVVPAAGQVLAVQNIGNRWFPLPLGDKGFSAPVIEGEHVLPCYVGGSRPRPLSEDNDRGMHHFAFLVADEDTAQLAELALSQGSVIPQRVLDTLAGQLNDGSSSWQVHRINVLFVD